MASASYARYLKHALQYESEASKSTYDKTDSILMFISDYANGGFSEDSIGFISLLALMKLLWNVRETMELLPILGTEKYFTVLRNLSPLNVKEAQMAVERAIRRVDSEESISKIAKKVMMAIEIVGSDGKVACPANNKAYFDLISSPGNDMGYQVTIGFNKETQRPCDYILPASVFVESKKSFDSRDEEYTHIQNLPLSSYKTIIPNTSDAGEVVLHNLKLLWENRKLSAHDIQMAHFAIKRTRPRELWMRNIRVALNNNDVESVQYNLYVVPYLINLPGITNYASLLHEACIKDKPELVTALCNAGDDTGLRDETGKFPIHHAKSAKVIHALGKADADISAVDSNGQTLLDIAVEKRSEAMMEALFHYIDISIPDKDDKYWLPSTIINNRTGGRSAYGLHKVVKQILRKIPERSYANEYFGKVVWLSYDEKVLSEHVNAAIHTNNMTKFRAMLALASPLNYPRSWDSVVSLVYCAKHNYIERVRLLCDNGAELNHKNSKGENAFRIAARKGYWELARMLSDYGIDRDALGNDGYSILHIAYLNKQMDLLEFCLKCGCSVNVKDRKNRTVFYKVLQDKDYELGDRLLKDYNGDISVTGKHGDTLLHLAYKKKDLEGMRYLIERRVPIDTPNRHGRIVLGEALLEKNYDVANMLIDAGANVNFRYNGGNTPLMIIALSEDRQKDLFMKMLAHGADPNIRNDKGSFVISELMKNKKKNRSEEVEQLLARSDLMVSDEKSPHEPIIAAVASGNKSWFEAILAAGATLLNTTGNTVLADYIASDIFDESVFMKQKLLTGENLAGPLFACISKKREDLFHYLWKPLTEGERHGIYSRVNRLAGQNIFMYAIQCHCERIIRTFMNGDAFEVLQNRVDNEKNTLLMYCAMHDNKQLLSQMIDELTTGRNSHWSVLTATNKAGDALITCVANKGWEDLVEKLFLLNVDLNHCNEDSNGILAEYKRCMMSAEKRWEYGQRISWIQDILLNINYSTETDAGNNEYSSEPWYTEVRDFMISKQRFTHQLRDTVYKSLHNFSSLYLKGSWDNVGRKQLVRDYMPSIAFRNADEDLATIAEYADAVSDMVRRTNWRFFQSQKPEDRREAIDQAVNEQRELEEKWIKHIRELVMFRELGIASK